jgi:hypothetical protein
MPLESDVPKYSKDGAEDVPYSEAPSIGRSRTRSALREEFNLPPGENLHKFVDDWLEEAEEKNRQKMLESHRLLKAIYGKK